MDTSEDNHATDLSAGLLLGPDSRKPAKLVWIAAAQHLLAMFSGVTMVPLIVALSVGVKPEATVRFISMAILVSGIATLLQVNRLGPLGSGYLCVMGSSGLFIPPAIMAGKAGGLPLIFGMTLLLSPVEAVMSRAVKPLRKLCPPHVTGTIIMLVGCSLIPVSVKQLGGGPRATPFASPQSLAIGMLTLIVILAASVNRRPFIRASSIIIGTAAGWITAVASGCAGLPKTSAQPWILLPRPGWAGWDFDVRFVLPFAVAYFVTGLETYGDIHAIGEISEGRVEDVDPKRVSGGLLTDALGSALAGLFGTSPNTSYSGNIAIVQLTGVAARRVGILVGAGLILLSATPKLGALLSAMPAPVLGGAMIGAVATMIGIGLRIAARGLNTSTDMLVVGMSLCVGLATQSVPELFDQMPAFLQSLLKTSTCTGALCAIALNLFLTSRSHAPGPPAPESHEERPAQ
ncbi:MAG: purine/pyrimidine permease [Lentisphaerae bacterium]|jgi:xanthine permease XanP|nr:purine/pyrimidine permease [Lentisphaerota bacterium]MBT4818257.1 purine/pyrimidine permease [Lentisphaerota bacterium]MBT5606057.1 purine/pyrimidine permease [Lentisphaerota bacterium]MBT7058052.1 purine/pyrimidine permease [Lentisphaerota bacterium]MBT7845954.1 purine/pyrimidine permease [Lentisphaerota bacterium]